MLSNCRDALLKLVKFSAGSKSPFKPPRTGILAPDFVPARILSRHTAVTELSEQVAQLRKQLKSMKDGGDAVVVVDDDSSSDNGSVESSDLQATEAMLAAAQRRAEAAARKADSLRARKDALLQKAQEEAALLAAATQQADSERKGILSEAAAAASRLASLREERKTAEVVATAAREEATRAAASSETPPGTMDELRTAMRKALVELQKLDTEIEVAEVTSKHATAVAQTATEGTGGGDELGGNRADRLPGGADDENEKRLARAMAFAYLLLGKSIDVFGAAFPGSVAGGRRPGERYSWTPGDNCFDTTAKLLRPIVQGRDCKKGLALFG